MPVSIFVNFFLCKACFYDIFYLKKSLILISSDSTQQPLDSFHSHSYHGGRGTIHFGKVNWESKKEYIEEKGSCPLTFPLYEIEDTVWVSAKVIINWIDLTLEVHAPLNCYIEIAWSYDFLKIPTSTSTNIWQT